MIRQEETQTENHEEKVTTSDGLKNEKGGRLGNGLTSCRNRSSMLHERCSGNGTAATASARAAAEVTVGDRGGGGHVSVDDGGVGQSSHAAVIGTVNWSPPGSGRVPVVFGVPLSLNR